MLPVCYLDTGDIMFNPLAFPGLRRMLVAGLMAISVSGFAQDDLIWNALDPDNTVYLEIAGRHGGHPAEPGFCP